MPLGSRLRTSFLGQEMGKRRRVDWRIGGGIGDGGWWMGDGGGMGDWRTVEKEGGMNYSGWGIRENFRIFKQSID